MNLPALETFSHVEEDEVDKDDVFYSPFNSSRLSDQTKKSSISDEFKMVKKVKSSYKSSISGKSKMPKTVKSSEMLKSRIRNDCSKIQARERARLAYLSMSPEQKLIYNEKVKLRMRDYRRRQKEKSFENNLTALKQLTIRDIEKLEKQKQLKREKWRGYKKTWRKRLSEKEKILLKLNTSRKQIENKIDIGSNVRPNYLSMNQTIHATSDIAEAQVQIKTEIESD